MLQIIRYMPCFRESSVFTGGCCALLYLFVCITSHTAEGQPADSLLTLPIAKVLIESNRLEDFSQGLQVETFDSSVIALYQGANTGELLVRLSPVFVKSYSPGGLATPSLRGGAAHQTVVLWNGFNLQSSMNGTLDLSLAPTYFVDNIKLQYGAGSALFGSGAVGGTLHLNNKSVIKKGRTAEVSSQIGSFRNYKQLASVVVGGRRYGMEAKAFYNRALNNFAYIDNTAPGSPETRQIHNQLQQFGLMLNQSLLIGNRQRLNLRYWMQNSNRQLPPTMLEAQSTATQSDLFHRVAAQWQLTERNYSLTTRAAFFYETLVYADTVADIDAQNRSRTFIFETEGKKAIGAHFMLNGGINYTFEWALADGYAKGVQRHRAALFIANRFTNTPKNLIVTVALRQEVVDQSLVPTIPSIGAEYLLQKNLKLKANVSRTYRLPTFNDLYWLPGGNKNLKAEEGWSEEMTLVLHREWGKGLLEVGATVFNSNIQNRIIWLPGTNYYWLAQNIGQVWSRGTQESVEAEVRVDANWRIRARVNHQFVVSTSGKPSTANITSGRRQLIYVPRQVASASLYVYWKHWFFTYNQSVTGQRYTATDNSTSLLPYRLGGLAVGGLFQQKNLRLNFHFRLNNLFNTSYQAVAFRPMPLRNYELSLSLQFLKTKKNNKLL